MYVKDTWSKILGRDPLAMKRLDRSTVKAVELTAPGACTRDAERLRSELTQGQIFGAFTKQEREAIWSELLATSTDRLIPSLFTFFEDARYLRGLTDCMKRLMKLTDDEQISRTLQRSFTGVNQKLDSYLIQVSESQLEARLGDADDQVDLGCRQMWIMMMRSYGDKDMSSKWRILEHLLGFETRQMQDLVEQCVCQETGSDSELSSLREKPKRCGIPRRKDQRHDRQLLFADALHGSVHKSAGVTSFFVRRSVYLAFFGHPHPTRTDDRVMYRVPIASVDHTDHTEHLAATQTAGLGTEQLDRAQRAAQECADREQRHQEMQERQYREQTRLTKLAHALGQERNELTQLRLGLDVRQEELQTEQQRLGHLSRSLKAQEVKHHTEWSEQRQKEQQQQEGVRDLTTKEARIQQQQEELGKEQQRLDQQKEAQDQLARDLAVREVQAQDLAVKEARTQQQQEELGKEQQRLGQQKEAQDQLARDLAAKEARIQQQQEELGKEQQRLDQRKEGQNQLQRDLAAREVQNRQRQEELQREYQKLDQQQQKQTKLAHNQEKENKVDQSNQKQQVLEHKEQTIVARDDLLAQEKKQGQDQLGPVTFGQSEQEMEVSELTDHWKEEHKKRLPAVKPKRKTTKGTPRVDNSPHTQNRPITQIGLGKSESVKAIDREIPMQSEQKSPALEEPEPESRNLAGPKLDSTLVEQERIYLPREEHLKRDQIELESDDDEGRLESISWMRKKPRYSYMSVSNQEDPARLTEQVSTEKVKDPTAVRLPDVSGRAGQKRKTPSIAKQWNEASTPAEASSSRSIVPEGLGQQHRALALSSPGKSGRRITQLGGLTQQQTAVSDQSDQQQRGGKSAASPVLITFKSYTGDTWVVDQKIEISLHDPEAVRRAAEKYQSDAMKLYDSRNRVLSIETCLEDVLQDGTKTIFVRSLGEMMPSTSKPPQTAGAETGEELL
jgi:hypothetical protein